ncbi:hypothetical protein C8T65DRAFT_675368 [Cerioporus squamosus]|nr:hypothetical protein C8T65DRAFT_675368 [Cerioporus squamosus]
MRTSLCTALARRLSRCLVAPSTGLYQYSFSSLIWRVATVATPPSRSGRPVRYHRATCITTCYPTPKHHVRGHAWHAEQLRSRLRS